MNITYNVEIPERKRTCGKKSEETLAIIAFLANPKQYNMCFEYESEKVIKSKRSTLQSYRRTNNLQNKYEIISHVEAKKIYIVKTKKSAKKAA